MHSFYLDFCAALPPFLSGIMACANRRIRSVLDNSSISLFVAFLERRSYRMQLGLRNELQ